MRLTVLMDNTALIDRYLTAEPGLSLLVEDGDTRVLFDAGYSGAFLDNARRMGLDLLCLDYLVFSHRHLDHTWGVDALNRLYLEAAIEGLAHERPVVVAHPAALDSMSHGPLPEIGSAVDAGRLGRQYVLELSEDPVWLTERLVFLGHVERGLDFERGGEYDLPDDSALAWVGEQGLVVVTGCAHTGVCNTVAHARRVTGVERVQAIVGGLHLLDAPAARLEATADWLAGLDLDALHACHCTDLAARIALAGRLPVRETGVGLRLAWEESDSQD